MTARILAVLLALTLAFSALAAPAPKPSPTIAVSCGGLCTVSSHISFTGSGFKQGVTVYLTVEDVGGVVDSINVNIGSSGSFSVDFGGLLTYAVGAYTVNAYSISGKRATVVATTAFTVVVVP